jgi:hypothetical protein
MKQLIYFSIVFLLVIIIFSTCAQRGGFSPVGVTGGSDGGYGQSKDYYRQSSYYRYDEVIYGVWADDNQTLTLNSEGSFELKSDEKVSVGTFSITDEMITLSDKSGPSYAYKYLLTKDRLVLEISE